MLFNDLLKIKVDADDLAEGIIVLVNWLPCATSLSPPLVMEMMTDALLEAKATAPLPTCALHCVTLLEMHHMNIVQCTWYHQYITQRTPKLETRADFVSNVH